MPNELLNLIDRLRSVKMTESQQEAQRRNFALGNGRFENPRITRESIDAAAKAMETSKANGPKKPY